ncbi:MAG: DUF6198 family protein [Lachnospiraceae bacterium]|nr:DUF6198 family protein [Lachnospiraceae bacterium]
MFNSSKIQQMTRRIIVYTIGLFIMALGVSISKISNLGVSPVNSVPSVLSDILEVDMGICTTGVFLVFIIIQIIILRKEFQPVNLLQVVCSFMFGFFVSITNKLSVNILPQCNSYIIQLLYVFISIILVAMGILLYLEASILSLPGEGVMQAVSNKTGIAVSTAKMVFDWSLVTIAVATSLIFTRSLMGVREGTVLAAFGVGICLKFFTNHLKMPLNKMLSND